MKHATTRGLYAYWNERRGTRAAPERADIDPMGLRRELGDIFMLAADFIGQPRFRLAGTRVCAAFGREIKGEAFASLFDETTRKSIDDLMVIVESEAIGAVAGLTGRAGDHSQRWSVVCRPWCSEKRRHTAVLPLGSCEQARRL